MKATRRKTKHAWQRLTRGWSDDELWSLDETIATFALPRVKALRERGRTGCPIVFETEEAWHETLDRIIEGLEVSSSGVWDLFDPELSTEENKRRRDRHQENMEMFGKYFNWLWE